MSQLVFSTMNSGYSSTQAYLATVQYCPSCKSQRPKESFKMIDGESICKDCQDELIEERE